MWVRLLPLVLLGALAAPASAPAAETGVNLAINQTVDGPSTAAAARVGWVREFVSWEVAEPSPGVYDEFYLANLRRQAEAFRARGIKVLLVVSATPGWAAGPNGAGLAGPGDPAAYGRFAAHLARTVPGLRAIEIWNEADESTFWRGAPQPGAYAALLRAAYPAIKAADSGITVVTTGMVGNNYQFLSDVYAAGGGGSFDAVGVHTDTACLLTSPAEYYREPNGRVGRYSFTGYREVHNVMSANGDGGKRIWMTEIGWNTGSRKPGSCRDGAVAGTRAEGVSEKTQARFLTLAYRCLQADSYVQVAMWFSLQDVGKGAGYGDHLGLIRTGGKRKPAFAAMRKLRNGSAARAARCGGRSDRVPPSMIVRQPTEGALLTDDENMPVSVRAQDNPGGVGMRRVELYVDGSRVRTWGGGRISSSWFGFRSIGYGTHAVRLRALDRAGNAAERSLTIQKVTPSSFGDSAGPRVRWRSVPRRAGATTRIAVEVVDRGPAGLRKATLYVDGQRLRTRRADGLWRPRIFLRGPGRHRITIRAEDRAGNVSRSRRYVTRG
jgi:hypothetical protein